MTNFVSIIDKQLAKKSAERSARIEERISAMKQAGVAEMVKYNADLQKKKETALHKIAQLELQAQKIAETV